MPETTAPKKSSLWKTLLKVFGVLTGIVAVEMVAAAMLLPSAQDTEMTARQLKKAQKGTLEERAGEDADEPAAVATLKQTREVDLGRYNVTRYNPESDTTLIVDFELFGVVLATDEGNFAAQFEANKVRLREQVIMTLAAADTTDLTDAELGLLKRRILEKTNRALGKPLVQEVLFSKFNFVER
jgi:flagellar basal body-associated protein FliL